MNISHPATVSNTVSTLNQWKNRLPKPYLIAGPCSAESEEQVLTIARQLEQTGVNLFRAGIWKPRTRPNSFEGMGEEALPWLQSVQSETGLEVAIEVAKPKHVEAALKAGIDVLWIGARTTVNPFLVQELVESLKGIDIPVMIKNPINPDASLWLGAIERFGNSGHTKLMAIHRGFSTYSTSKYRNKPMWEIPIELRRRMPDLPIFCDPSHICGTRELIQEVAQQALDLDFDGLMVETHPDPDNAMSDSKQQITPASFDELINALQIRFPTKENSEIDNELEELRAKIDRLDNYIIQLLSERMDIAREIGQYKKENNVPIHQPERWAEIVRTRLAQGTKKHLTEDFMLNLYQQIHKESILHQTELMREETENPAESK